MSGIMTTTTICCGVTALLSRQRALEDRVRAARVVGETPAHGERGVEAAARHIIVKIRPPAAPLAAAVGPVVVAGGHTDLDARVGQDERRALGPERQAVAG